MGRTRQMSLVGAGEVGRTRWTNLRERRVERRGWAE